MKVCCGTGRPYDELSSTGKKACNNYHCVGPISVEDYDILLTELGTFDTKDCISHEDMRHLFKAKGKKDETTGD